MILVQIHAERRPIPSRICFSAKAAIVENRETAHSTTFNDHPALYIIIEMVNRLRIGVSEMVVTQLTHMYRIYCVIVCYRANWRLANNFIHILHWYTAVSHNGIINILEDSLW